MSLDMQQAALRALHNMSPDTQQAVADTLAARQAPYIYVGQNSAPAFKNSWVNFSTTDEPARFWKDSFGMVWISGLIKSGTVGVVAFTLPPGYWPDFALLAPSVANNGTSDVISHVTVTTTGDVVPQADSNTWFSLNIPAFRAVH